MQTSQPNQEQIPINQPNGEISEIAVVNKPQQKLSPFEVIRQWSALSLALVVVVLTILAASLDTLAQEEVELPYSISPVTYITAEQICQFTKLTVVMDRSFFFARSLPTFSASETSVTWRGICNYNKYSDDMISMSDDEQDEICKTYGVTSTMIAFLVISMIFLLFGVLIELIKIFGHTYEIEKFFGHSKWIVRYIANIFFFISCLFMFAVVITWLFGDKYCYGDERYLNMDLGTSIYIFIASVVFGLITAHVAV